MLTSEIRVRTAQGNAQTTIVPANERRNAEAMAAPERTARCCAGGNCQVAQA